METNWKSFSSKLCHGKILFECGIVIRWNLLSSNFAAEQPATARPPYSQLRHIGWVRRREARAGPTCPAPAVCNSAAAPPARKPLRSKVAIRRNSSAWRTLSTAVDLEEV